MSRMLSLPEDIIFKILSGFRAKSIMRLRRVCKSWYKFFSDPGFLKRHHRHRHAIENNNFTVLVKQ
ncbi:hypothetical protein MKX03_010926, partial [Papaver bracteatum]